MSNYIVEAYLESHFYPANYVYSGIVLRESSSSKSITWGPCYDTTNNWAVRAIQWNNDTTVGTVYATVAVPYSPNWFRIRDDGSLRYFEHSFNGVDWITAHSVGRTDFITPNRIGWGGVNSGSGKTQYLRLRSWN